MLLSCAGNLQFVRVVRPNTVKLTLFLTGSDHLFSDVLVSVTDKQKYYYTNVLWTNNKLVPFQNVKTTTLTEFMSTNKKDTSD